MSFHFPSIFFIFKRARFSEAGPGGLPSPGCVAPCQDAPGGTRERAGGPKTGGSAGQVITWEHPLQAEEEQEHRGCPGVSQLLQWVLSWLRTWPRVHSLCCRAVSHGADLQPAGFLAATAVPGGMGFCFLASVPCLVEGGFKRMRLPASFCRTIACCLWDGICCEMSAVLA